MTEDTPAIKAWKESLAKKLASPKHRMKEAEKKLRLLTDRIAHETSSERDDEWRREFEAAEQEFKQASRKCGRKRKSSIGEIIPRRSGNSSSSTSL